MYYVIGDIHGCKDQLVELVGKIHPTKDDHVVFVGDYIDRGPDAPGVIDYILEMRTFTNVIALKGNHEDMFIKALRDGKRQAYKDYCANHGFETTIKQYGVKDNAKQDWPWSKVLNDMWDQLPKTHRDFFEGLGMRFEIDGYHISHAVSAYIDLEFMGDTQLLWANPVQPDFAEAYLAAIDPKFTKKKHKRMCIIGHVPVKDVYIDRDNNWTLVDTGCVYGNKLSAYCLNTGEIFTVDGWNNPNKDD